MNISTEHDPRSGSDVIIVNYRETQKKDDMIATSIIMDEKGEYNGAGQDITNGAIYKVDKDGKETMVGYWNSNLGRFSEVK